MQMQLFSVRRISVRSAFFLALALLLAVGIAAGQETSLFSFYSPYGDALPIGGLIPDASGNLYGVTFYGGQYGNGSVFKLSPSASGWQQTVLHSFNPDGIDGWAPTSAPVFDAAGNLYGTTEWGGSGNCSVFGCGTVYELTPNANGTWNETILHDFTGYDGFEIHPGLTIDAAGNLFGMASAGGSFAGGTVFELSPVSGGGWNFSVLHQFFGGKDGNRPQSAPTLDAAGNLYGTTAVGGGQSATCVSGCGVVFELSPVGNGTWTEKILHNFTTGSMDGTFPQSTVVLDAAGNLYSTAFSGGGKGNAGIVFELTPNPDGRWTEKIIHNFNEMTADGTGPWRGITLDAAGNLYGVTIDGGSHGRGTLFELSPSANGAWTETILANFLQNSVGFWPNGGPILVNGNLFGINGSGGGNDQGTVFEVTP
jgi:uncharacterized repeat protein (TIGR03803 family)